MKNPQFDKDLQYYKFCFYGFFKNLRFFDPFILLFFLSKGQTYLEIGSLIAIREVTRNIFEIPAGILADTLGRKRTMISSFIFYIVSFLVFYTSDSFAFFAIGMLVYAFGDAFRTGTHKAMILDYLKRNNWQKLKTDYYGHTRSWSQKGSAFSALIAALFVFFDGSYERIFLYSIIPYVLDLLLLISYPSYLNGTIKEFSWKQIKCSFSEVMKETKQILFSLQKLKLFTNTSIYSGFHKASKDYLQVLIQLMAVQLVWWQNIESVKREALFIGVSFFLLFQVTAIFSKRAGRIRQYFRSDQSLLNKSLFFGYLFGLIAAAFWYSEWFILAIVGFLFIYLSENIRRPVCVAAISEKSNHKTLATTLSAESQLKSFYAAVFAPILGFLSDQFGVEIGLMMFSCLMLFSLIPLRLRETE